jgi:GTPase SAR1 family protein
MRSNEIKIEIQKIIDTITDDMLEEIYNILKELADKNPDALKLSHNLNKILTEDNQLLQSLAK